MGNINSINRPLAKVNVGQAFSLTAIASGGLQTRPTDTYARGLIDFLAYLPSWRLERYLLAKIRG